MTSRTRPISLPSTVGFVPEPRFMHVGVSASLISYPHCDTPVMLLHPHLSPSGRIILLKESMMEASIISRDAVERALLQVAFPMLRSVTSIVLPES